ncbi:hypothetical protein HY251_21505 [bacterium]|nr:hypothetical protein [bacterium]
MSRALGWRGRLFVGSLLALTGAVVALSVVVWRGRALTHRRLERMLEGSRQHALELSWEDSPRGTAQLAVGLVAERSHPFDPEREAVDAWGHPFRVKQNDPDGALYYSCGPNGIDEQGEGDDIGVYGTYESMR